MIAAEPLIHIRLGANGVAWIDDTNVKVIEVAVDKLAASCGKQHDGNGVECRFSASCTRIN